MQRVHQGGFTSQQKQFVDGLINPQNKTLNAIAAEILGEDNTTARGMNSQSSCFAQLVRLVIIRANKKVGDIKALEGILSQGITTFESQYRERTGIADNEANTATYNRICEALVDKVEKENCLAVTSR
jgi:hypothetical protein